MWRVIALLICLSFLTPFAAHADSAPNVGEVDGFVLTQNIAGDHWSLAGKTIWLLYVADDGSDAEAYSATIQPNNSFTFTDVPAGAWYITTLDLIYDDIGGACSASRPFAVQAATINETMLWCRR